MSNGLTNILKIAVGGVITAGAVLSGSLISSSVENNAGKNRNSSSEPQVVSSEEPYEEIDPITDEIKAIADQYDYTFDPLSVIIDQEEKYEFSEPKADAENPGYYDPNLASVPNGATRDGYNLVYYFEGAYAEGYQGDYSQTYGYLYLWDDGLFGGRISDRDVKGYWYNSSLKNETDEPDCLNMVSNVSRYESIITDPSSGFYHYQAYLYCHMSWGGDRSIIMNGYPYYPEVAMFIDTQSEEVPTCEVNKNFDISFWTPSRVLKNLSYSAVFIQTDVTWEAEDGSITIEYVDNQKARGIASITANFNKAGEKDITVKWNGLEASVTVNVTEAAA